MCSHDCADWLNPDKENILIALKEVLREVMAVGRDGTPSAAGSGAHTEGGVGGWLRGGPGSTPRPDSSSCYLPHSS